MCWAYACSVGPNGSFTAVPALFGCEPRDSKISPPRSNNTTTAPAANAIGNWVLGSRSGISSGDIEEALLAAELQPKDQRLGEPRRRHAFLHRFNIVRNAPEFDHFVVDVRNCERGARVPIARLADRTWIQQVRRIRFNRQRSEFAFARRLEMQHAHFVVFIPKRKPALEM